MRPLPALQAVPTSIRSDRPSPSEPPSGVRRRPCLPPPLLAVLEDVLHRKHRRAPRSCASDAEDILQDTLLLFVEKQQCIRPGSGHAWFYSALHNRERELLREKALRRKYAPLVAAYCNEHTSRGGSPDAPIRQHDILSALVWLLGQVARSRRDVAERHMLDGVTLAEIAAGSGEPINTVEAKWRRARADMRAAIARERARLDPVFVAVLTAIISAWFLWLAGSGRRVAGALTAAIGRDRRSPTPAAPAVSRAQRAAGPGAARGRHDAGPSPRGARIGAAAACAVLPLVLLKHVPIDVPPSPGAIFAASYADTAASLASEGRHDDDVRRDADHAVFTPFLATNAEREREWGAGAATPRAAPVSRPATAAPVSPVLQKMARGFLARATEALARGDVDIARDALSLYDLGIPGNPFPAERARVAATLRGRGPR